MEVDQITETLIRIDERTKNIEVDVHEIAGCVHDHEDRIRALEIQRAKDHGDGGGNGRTGTASAAGLGVGAGSVFALGKLLGWFRNAW